MEEGCSRAQVVELAPASPARPALPERSDHPLQVSILAEVVEVEEALDHQQSLLALLAQEPVSVLEEVVPSQAVQAWEVEVEVHSACVEQSSPLHLHPALPSSSVFAPSSQRSA